MKTISVFATAMLLLAAAQMEAQTEQIRRDSLRADSFLVVANKLDARDKDTAAYEHARQAFEIYTQLYGSNHTKPARARMFMARALRNMDRAEESIPLIQESRRVFEAGGETYLLVWAHNYLALSYRLMRRTDEALANTQAALALLRTDSARFAVTLADTKLSLGDLFNKERNYLAAVAVLEEVKSFYAAKKDTFRLGLIGYHLGNAYFGLHDYERAKTHYLSSFHNFKQIGLPETDSYYPDLRVQIGFCCQKTGDPALGLSHFLEAEKGYAKLGVEKLKYALFLENFSRFHLEEGHFQQAVEKMRLALASKERLFGPNSTRLLTTLPTLGNACLKAGQLTEAETCYRRAMRIAADSLTGVYRNLPRFYEKLAEIRLAAGDPDGCLARADSALTLAQFDFEHPEKFMPRDHYRELCQLYGRALFLKFEKNGNVELLRRADRYFETAARLLFLEIAEISANGSQELFFDRDRLVLEQWMELQMRLFEVSGDPFFAEKAFQISGKSKAFLLSEALRRSGALRFSGAPDSLLRTELELRSRISSAEKDLIRAAETGYDLDSNNLSLNEQLAFWREDYQGLHQRIGEQYPSYFQRRFLQFDRSLAELRSRWPAPDQGLLMYGLSAERLHIFALTLDTFVVRSVPLDFPLDSLVENFKNSITNYFTAATPTDNLYDTSLSEYIRLGQFFYKKLVAPVADVLPARVVIVPEGRLCYLPFEALLRSAPKDESNFKTYPFFSREKAISYCFSTDLLLEMSQPTDRKPDRNWLGIAPFASADDLARGDFMRSFFKNENLSPLPYSGREVAAIEGLFSEKKGNDTWVGCQASTGRFQTESERYRILHLATHSRADERLGDFSMLATACSGEPMPARDLYQMSLAAELVVLSSCEAGSGRLNRGEGIVGLVRAFAYAGARSIVASTWVASDRGTAKLMLHFYRQLLVGQPKDVALNAAREELIRQSPGESHPFFWSGFRVYGRVARF